MIKKTRNAEATKAKIIKNSMILFSKNGFERWIELLIVLVPF